MYSSEIYSNIGYAEMHPPHTNYPLIKAGQDAAEEVGFTKALFSGCIYLDGKQVTVAFIRSLYPRQGNVRRWYQHLMEDGYTLVIVDPCEEMTQLCESLNMKSQYNYLPEYGEAKEFYYWSPNSQ